MSILGKLNKAEDQEEVKDVIYRGNEPLPTGLYPATVKLAILKEAKSGAVGVELHLDIDGKNVREDIYLTNKAGDTFYTREKDGVDVNYPLPGYTTTNDLALLTAGSYIEDQETEKKTVDLWDSEAGEEIPQVVDMLEDIRGKKIIVGLFLDKDYKQKKTDAGKWVDDLSAPEVMRNSIHKLFSEDGFTVQEMIAELDEPVFINEWKESFGSGDYINDKTVAKKRKAAKAGPAAKAGAAASPAGSKPKTGMFNKKK